MSATTTPSRVQSTAVSGRTVSCCFNLRRSACLCATSPAFAGDLAGVIDDCLFSRSMVSATPIVGPSPAERNKTDRYRRCRSAGPAAAGGECPRSGGRTPWSRRDAFLTPQRTRRAVTDVVRTSTTRPRRQTKSPPAMDVGRDEPPRRVLDPLPELIPRLYRTYGYQFTKAYRQPAAPAAMRSPPATTRLTGAETSDEDSLTVSAMQRRTTSAGQDRTSTRSLKRGTTSPTRHHSALSSRLSANQ